jgi:hypothetical protein
MDAPELSQQMDEDTAQLSGSKRKLADLHATPDSQEAVAQAMTADADCKRPRTEEPNAAVALFDELVMRTPEYPEGTTTILGVNPELHGDLKRYIRNNKITIALVPYPGFDSTKAAPDRMLRTPKAALADPGAAFIRSIFMFGVNFDSDKDSDEDSPRGGSYTAHYAFMFDSKDSAADTQAVKARLHVRIADENLQWQEAKFDLVYAPDNDSCNMAEEYLEDLVDKMEFDNHDGLAGSLIASFVQLSPHLTYLSGATISRLHLPHNYPACVRVTRDE